MTMHHDSTLSDHSHRDTSIVTARTANMTLSQSHDNPVIRDDADSSFLEARSISNRPIQPVPILASKEVEPPLRLQVPNVVVQQSTPPAAVSVMSTLPTTLAEMSALATSETPSSVSRPGPQATNSKVDHRVSSATVATLSSNASTNSSILSNGSIQTPGEGPLFGSTNGSFGINAPGINWAFNGSKSSVSSGSLFYNSAAPSQIDVATANVLHHDGDDSVFSESAVDALTSLPLAEQESDANLQKREKAVREIMQTEQTYVEGLRKLVNHYVVPLRELATLGVIMTPPPDVSTASPLGLGFPTPLSAPGLMSRGATASPTHSVTSIGSSTPPATTASHMTSLTAITTSSSGSSTASVTSRKTGIFSNFLPSKSNDDSKDRKEIKGKICTVEDITMMFGNVEQLLSLHERLLSELEKRYKIWSPYQRIGDVFLQLLPYFKMYVAYLKSFPQAIATLQRLTSTSSQMKQFFSRAASHPALSMLPLNSYLTLPVQRIPRYTLLLTQLLQLTPQSHPDYAAINAATKAIATLASEVDLRILDAQRQSAVVETQRAVSLLPHEIVIPSRRFLLRSGTAQPPAAIGSERKGGNRTPNSPSASKQGGPIARVTRAYTTNSSGKIKVDREWVEKYTYFLFNDLLLWCKQTHSATPSASSPIQVFGPTSVGFAGDFFDSNASIRRRQSVDSLSSTSTSGAYAASMTGVSVGGAAVFPGEQFQYKGMLRLSPKHVWLHDECVTTQDSASAMSNATAEIPLDELDLLLHVQEPNNAGMPVLAQTLTHHLRFSDHATRTTWLSVLIDLLPIGPAPSAANPYPMQRRASSAYAPSIVSASGLSTYSPRSSMRPLSPTGSLGSMATSRSSAYQQQPPQTIAFEQLVDMAGGMAGAPASFRAMRKGTATSPSALSPTYGTMSSMSVGPLSPPSFISPTSPHALAIHRTQSVASVGSMASLESALSGMSGMSAKSHASSIASAGSGWSGASDDASSLNGSSSGMTGKVGGLFGRRRGKRGKRGSGKQKQLKKEAERREAAMRMGEEGAVDDVDEVDEDALKESEYESGEVKTTRS